MRNAFFKEFKKLMQTDQSLFFLTGDTGFNLVETIFDQAPNRALNVGVAEQNLIGIASGLVNVGFIPICYAITNFLVERCFEQIRNDVCLHEYKVILVGTSTGYDNGALGATHHKLDDIGAIKVLPNLNIYSPGGKKSMSVILKEAIAAKHASFIRISKGDLKENGTITSPNHYIYEVQTPVLVISHGKMVGNAASAHKLSPVFSLYSMDRIKPLDDKVLIELFNRFEKIVVIEDNFRSGLYNSLCQWAIEHNIQNRQIISIAPEEAYDDIVGSSNFLEDKHGLSPNKIGARLNQIISIKNSN
jgi:transketolase